MALLGKGPVQPITNPQGTTTAHNAEWLFKNYWTAKEFIKPGEGLSNTGGTGWVGAASQVTEHTTDPAPNLWQQTSLWNYEVDRGWIKPPTELPEPDLRDGRFPGVWATFYPKPLPIDYGAWIVQVHADNKGIAAFEDLGNYTYRAEHYYHPNNLSLERGGSTLAGLKSKGLIRE